MPSTESTSIGYGPLAAGLFVAVVIAVVIVQVALIPAITADNKIKFDAMEAKLDAIEKRFPELKDSIDAIKADHDKKIQDLQANLATNSDSDKKYRDYVDTVNTYVSNTKALEMSSDVRTRVFGK
jgi:actin-related protein